jgi:hypothetical protein
VRGSKGWWRCGCGGSMWQQWQQRACCSVQRGKRPQRPPSAPSAGGPRAGRRERCGERRCAALLSCPRSFGAVAVSIAYILATIHRL